MPVLIGTTPITSSTNINAATNATHYFHIWPNTITGTTYRTIWYNISGFAAHYIYVANSKLYVLDGAFNLLGASTDGLWSVPISNQTEYQVTIKHEWGNDAANPVVYLNGVSQTVTEVQTPNLSFGIGATHMIIGAQAASSLPFDGRIGDFAWWNVQLDNAWMEILTKSRKMGIPLQISVANLEGYWSLDDIADGVIITNSSFKDYKGTNDLATTSGTGKANSYLSY